MRRKRREEKKLEAERNKVEQEAKEKEMETRKEEKKREKEERAGKWPRWHIFQTGKISLNQGRMK